MYDERKVFSVTEEAVNVTKRQAHDMGRLVLSQRVIDHLCLTQPDLYAFTMRVCQDGRIDSDAYSNGAINTYASLFNQLQLNRIVPRITGDDINMHALNVAEQGIFAITEDDSERVTEDLCEVYDDDAIGAFLDRLEKSSPEFSDKIINFVLMNYPSMRQKKSFFRGVYDVFMPFYRKHEAEYIHNSMVWYPELLQSLEDGRYALDTLPDDSADS